MTKLTKILLGVLAAVIVLGGGFYWFENQRPISADEVATRSTVAPSYGLASTDPSTPGIPSSSTTARYNWPITSRLLTANYNSVVYVEGGTANQIKLADVAVKKVNADGTETDIKGFALQSLNSGKSVAVMLPANLTADTIYHWTIKPSGNKYTEGVDTKFLTASSGKVVPLVTAVSESADALITMQQDRAAFCSLDLYNGTSKVTTLYSGVTYKACSADMYNHRASSVSLTTTGSPGQNPAVKTQQTFSKMLELNSVSDRQSSDKYSIKASATNSVGTNSKTLAINHIDPVGVSQLTQVSDDTYSITTDPINGTNGKPLANTAISVVITHNGASPTTTNFTTDANGRLVIPKFVVDPNKTEFVDLNATYLVGTVKLPVLGIKFLLANY